MEQEGGSTGSSGAGPSMRASTGAEAAEALDPAAAPRSCAWCGTAASPTATTCRSCGAALAQRESIGELAIPGLTAVAAALQDFDKRPLHLRGPSPSQGLAPALIVGAVAGGPIGIAAIGGVAAVAAAEFLGARRPGDRAALEDVGRPSEVVLRALEHLDDPQAPEPAAGTDAGVEAAAPDDGTSIWRDLPPVERSFELDGQRQEEGSPDGY